MPVRQRCRKRRRQFFRADFALLKVLLHQIFIDFDNLIDDRGVRILDGREVRVAGGFVEHVDHTRRAAGGQVDRQALAAKCFTNLLDQRFEFNVVRVDFVDHDHAAAPGVLGALHHATRNHLDARRRADHHRHGFDRGQHAQRVTDEVGEPRCVDQVYVLALMVDAYDRGREAVLVFLFFLLEIAHGVVLFDLPGRGDGAGLVQQGLCERGLAAAAVADQCDVTNVRGGVFRHEFDPCNEAYGADTVSGEYKDSANS